MQQCGIYEQLITQLLTSRLDRERFYVGERQLEPAEAAVWLSRFLSRVLEYAVGSVTGEDQLQRQIELANQLLLWLKDRTQDPDFIREGANKWIAPSPRTLCPHLKCPSLQKPDFLLQVFGY